MAGVNFKQVTKRLRDMFDSDVPNKVDVASDDAKKLAHILSSGIDSGGIKIGLVHIPGLRFPEVVITAGQPAPGQVSLTLICDLSVQQALSEAEMLCQQAYDEWDGQYSQHGL